MVVRELFPHRTPFAAKGFTYALDRWHLYDLSSDPKGITRLACHRHCTQALDEDSPASAGLLESSSQVCFSKSSRS